LAQTARKIAAQDGVLGLWLGAGGKCTENLGLSAFLSLGNKHVTRQHEQKIYIRNCRKYGKKSGTRNLLYEMFVALGERFA